MLELVIRLTKFQHSENKNRGVVHIILFLVGGWGGGQLLTFKMRLQTDQVLSKESSQDISQQEDTTFLPLLLFIEADHLRVHFISCHNVFNVYILSSCK